MSGGSIINVVQYAIIKSMERYHKMKQASRRHVAKQALVVTEDEVEDPCNPEPEFIVYLSEIIDGIRNELIKEVSHSDNPIGSAFVIRRRSRARQRFEY